MLLQKKNILNIDGFNDILLLLSIHLIGFEPILSGPKSDSLSN